MIKTTETDLTTILNHLSLLRPECAVETPQDELKRILSTFMLSKGRQIHYKRPDQQSARLDAYVNRFQATYLPFDTMLDFCDISPNQVTILALGVASLFAYTAWLDNSIDAPLAVPTEAKLAIHHLLLHAYHAFSSLFPFDSPFWNELEKQLSLTSQAVMLEYNKQNDTVHPYTFAEFKQIAQEKMTLFQINCVGLSILNGTPEYIPVLNDCWDAVMLANAIHDDVVDWQEDYHNKNYTYLLSQILLSPPFQADVEAGNLPALAEVGAAIFCTDVIERLYLAASQQLDEAAKKAAQINCQALVNLIRQTQASICPTPSELFKRKLVALIAMNKGDAQ